MNDDMMQQIIVQQAIWQAMDMDDGTGRPAAAGDSAGIVGFLFGLLLVTCLVWVSLWTPPLKVPKKP